MLKKILKISIASYLLSLLPALALASSFTMSSGAIKTNPGKTFTLNLSVSPEGKRIYTAKANLSFPADLVEVKSFTFAQGWMALSQSGYDSIDNKNGTLIKTAGFPNGFTAKKTLGTVTFSAKKTGQGAIKIGDASLLLDVGSQNSITGALAQASLAIETAPVAQQPAPAPKPVALTPAPAPAPTPEQEQVAQATRAPLPQIPESSPVSGLANIGNGISLGTGNWAIGIIISLILMAGAIYLVYDLNKKKLWRKNS